MQAYRLAALSAIVLYAFAAPDDAVYDLQGRAVRPELEQTAVLLFVRTDCPISNRYAPEVQRLHARFAAAGVQFWLVYLDKDGVRNHLNQYGYRMDAVIDSGHRLARSAGATTTPEAAVYHRGKLVYRGRIDDRYLAIGKARPAATVHDLEDVLAFVAAGGRVPFRSTKAVGCVIEELR